MIKKPTTLYLNFLPLVILVALILGAGYFLLAGDIKIPFLNTTNRLEVKRLANFPTTVETQNAVDKMRLVIKNQQQLDEFVNSIDKYGAFLAPKDIDFNNEYLIVVSSKTFSETGHALKVKRIYKESDNNTLLVSIEQIDPDESCIKDMTQPISNVIVDIVSVKKTDKIFDFELIKKNDEECKIQ